jgi:hypothetical protein
MWATPFVKGSAKTEFEVQEPATRGSQTPVEYHCSGRPKTSRLPIRSGTDGVADTGEVLVRDDGDRVAGLPWVRTEICHPP